MNRYYFSTSQTLRFFFTTSKFIEPFLHYSDLVKIQRFSKITNFYLFGYNPNYNWLFEADLTDEIGLEDSFPRQIQYTLNDMASPLV